MEVADKGLSMRWCSSVSDYRALHYDSCFGHGISPLNSDVCWRQRELIRAGRGAIVNDDVLAWCDRPYADERFVQQRDELAINHHVVTACGWDVT